jgi:hypothetical protein
MSETFPPTERDIPQPEIYVPLISGVQVLTVWDMLGFDDQTALVVTFISLGEVARMRALGRSPQTDLCAKKEPTSRFQSTTDAHQCRSEQSFRGPAPSLEVSGMYHDYKTGVEDFHMI